MDAEAVIEAIEQGHFDGQLAPITTAIRERHQSGQVEMCWRIDFEGVDISEESLTIAELDFIERMLSTPTQKFFWAMLSPTVSAQHASALLMAVLRLRCGFDADHVQEVMKKHTWRSMLAAFSEYEVVRPPKDGSATGS